MINIYCTDEVHYDSIPDFLKEEHLEKYLEELYEEDISTGRYKDIDEVLEQNSYELVDDVADEHLKRKYPKDYWKRSLVWSQDEWSDGFKITYYSVSLLNKEDATKFIVDTIQEMSIDSTDLFIGAVENLK